MINNYSHLKPIRLAVLQRVCPDYRVALFKQLSATSNVATMLFIGSDLPHSKVKSTSNFYGINYRKLATFFVKIGSRVFPWHLGLVDQLRKFQPDVILCEGESHFLGYLQALYYQAVYNKRVAVMHWCFISLPGKLDSLANIRVLLKKFFRRFFDAFVVYSSFSRDCLIGLGEPANKIFIATNVGDVNHFFRVSEKLTDTPSEAKAKLGLADRFTVLYVGTLDPNKRPDLIIDLAAGLPQDKFNFVLLGSGVLLEELRQRVVSENLSNVYLPGRITENLPIYFRAADVLMVPGRGGIVMSEAMSFALPVIVSQGDGTEYDLVKDGETGFRLPNGSISEFRQALEYLSHHPDHCKKMGRIAQKRMETQFTTANMVNQIIAASYFAKNARSEMNIIKKPLLFSIETLKNGRFINLLRKIKIKFKKLIKLTSGQYPHFNKKISINRKWYGNDYGGFYVCPEFLNNISIVYSFGVGEDISFDEAMINNHNCQVFAFDPTPKSIAWVNQRRAKLSSKFRFFEYGIGQETGLIDFYLPKNTEHVSGSLVLQNAVDDKIKIKVKVKSFFDILKQFKHSKIDVLKMDIEGAEYLILDSLLDSSIQINQILIEFHDRLLDNGELKTKLAISKMQQHGYEIFGISDSFEEISFINKRLL